jgi:hypothetical protein
LDVFTARNIDLPRKVKYKARKSSSCNRTARCSAKIGRSYANFQKLSGAKLKQGYITAIPTAHGKKAW